MSDSEKPIELPPEGKATEALLRSLSFPDSQVNRDALMYEAGFQAAIALRDEASESVVGTGRTTNLVWPALTAVFATTAAVCLAMLYLDWVQVESPGDSPGVIAAGEPEEFDNESSDLESGEFAIVPKSNPATSPLETLLGLDKYQSYRHRISNTIRDLESRVSPVSWDGDGEAVGASKPLTSGSVLNAKKLIDDLL